jgi:transposase
MFFDPRQRRIWLYRDPVDMRKGHNSLGYLVTHVVLRDLMSGDIFLFVSKDRKSLKAIVWDGSGLCLFHKRLNRGRVMSFSNLPKEHEITSQDFTLIIGGAKVTLNIDLKAI